MKVVFDTNVVMSASFWRGKPSDCLSAWAKGQCEAVVSPQILSEYFLTQDELVSSNPKKMRSAWAETLADSAQFIFPLDRVRGILADPDDEIFLECALAADASIIVSGDKKHLLTLKEWRGIKIISPVEFLALL